MATSGGADDQEECGPLVFQRGKKLNDEYYIVSVRDNTESASVKFSAYELDSSEVFELSYTYAEFDALFKAHAELANPANKEKRYDWVVDRLDFAADSGGSAKRLTLANEPTAEDESLDTKGGAPPKPVPKDRLTYAERCRLRDESSKLEEKRTQNIALKSEKSRKAFVADLQEKRKLEELRTSSRQQRIDEERAERRETGEMQKRISEERGHRYEENMRRRSDKIDSLEVERKSRDMVAIREIIDEAKNKKERLFQKLEEARSKKREIEKNHASEAASKRETDEKLNSRRDKHISERQERQRKAEREYLELRSRQIEEIAEEKRVKEEKKQEYLRNCAAQRAAQLKEKHEKVEAWERLDDTRTQNNLKKENCRNMLMLNHIEHLREKYSKEEEDAAARKKASLAERLVRETKEADEVLEENRRKSEQEQKRNRNIATREGQRELKNQEYCEHIRNLRTHEALRTKDQQQLVASARDKTREERMRDRQLKREQEMAAATVNAQREEMIRKRERERDLRFAGKVKEAKESENQRQIHMDARKISKRLNEKENAAKRQEEEQQRRKQMMQLEEQRDAMIKERAIERNRREHSRAKGGGGSGGGRGDALVDAPQADNLPQ